MEADRAAAEEVARFRERRAEAGVGHVACHALYLVNLASRDEVIRAKSLVSLRATMETARAIGAEAVVFHVGSHLGYGFDEAVELVAPALRELLELTTDELWLCLENTAGAGATIGRSVDELAALFDALDGAPAARALHRLVPLVGIRSRRHRPSGARRSARRARRAHRPRPAPRPARQRLADGRSARTATATRSSGAGSSATGSPPSSATPPSEATAGGRRDLAGRGAGHRRPRPHRDLTAGAGAVGGEQPGAERLGRVGDAGEDPEARALARQLVELGVPAAELVLAAA